MPQSCSCLQGLDLICKLTPRGHPVHHQNPKPPSIPAASKRCLCLQGLEQVRKGASKVTPLTTRTSKAGQVPASPIPYANDLDLAPDGTIYFTDSSHFGPVPSPQGGFFDTLRACVLTMAQVLRVWRIKGSGFRVQC